MSRSKYKDNIVSIVTSLFSYIFFNNPVRDYDHLIDKYTAGFTIYKNCPRGFFFTWGVHWGTK